MIKLLNLQIYLSAKEVHSSKLPIILYLKFIFKKIYNYFKIFSLYNVTIFVQD